ncbi:MAG: LPS export ABC transporter periplasmic protein LptC [Bacteroidales bacterium]|nr:LPS export ABC transporter periplasmic protein LptC [Bacteroidales bacterium]
MTTEKHKHKTAQHHLTAGVVSLFVLCSCSNDMDTIRFFEKKEMPLQTLSDAEILRSKDGIVQMRLSAPEINRYDGENARTEYPKGVHVDFYDVNKRVKSTLSCKYAIDLDRKNQIIARNNVVIIDHQTGDTTYMETLVWDRNEKRIFSNNPLMSVNGQRVTYGDGFVSDEKLENPRILRQRGTIEWVDEGTPDDEEQTQ